MNNRKKRVKTNRGSDKGKREQEKKRVTEGRRKEGKKRREEKGIAEKKNNCMR